MEDTQKVMTEPDELSGKTWLQLRQCTRIALEHLRRKALVDRDARRIVAELEKVLAEGSTDPVT